MGKFPKKLAERLHAKKRFRERLGIKMSKNKRAELIAKIKRGYYRLLEYQSGGKSIYEIRDLDGKRCEVVYDRETEEIVTVLL